MNLLKLLTSAVAVTALTGAVALADEFATNATTVLPNTGIYFIISADSNEALQPMAPTLGQSIKLYPFDKGGSQKWVLTRKINPVTKKPTDRYTIRSTGGDSLYFTLPPAPQMSSTVGGPAYEYTLAPGTVGLTIKQKNGDALYLHTDAPYNSQALFGPDDGTPKFRWNVVKVE